MAPDNICVFHPNSMIFIIFLNFLKENLCCDNSLEAPCRGTSDEYPKHVFLEKFKNYLPDTLSYLEL